MSVQGLFYGRQGSDALRYNDIPLPMEGNTTRPNGRKQKGRSREGRRYFFDHNSL